MARQNQALSFPRVPLAAAGGGAGGGAAVCWLSTFNQSERPFDGEAWRRTQMLCPSEKLTPH